MLKKQLYRALIGVMLGSSCLLIACEEFRSLPGHRTDGLGSLATLQAMFTCVSGETSDLCALSFTCIGQTDTLPAAASLLLGALRLVIVRTASAPGSE